VDIYRLVPKEIRTRFKWKTDLSSHIMLQYYNICEVQYFSFQPSPSLFTVTVGSETFTNLKGFLKTTLWVVVTSHDYDTV